jgi:hypothetical protein
VEAISAGTCRASIEIDETRLAADVHVPKIVVHGLVAQRTRPVAISSATIALLKRSPAGMRLPAPDVRGLVAHREIDQAKRFVALATLHMFGELRT